MMEMGAKRMIFFVASCLPMREVADAARSSWVVWEKPCELDVGGGQRPTQPKAKPNPNRPAAPLSSLSLTTPATTDLVSSFHVRSSVRSSCPLSRPPLVLAVCTSSDAPNSQYRSFTFFDE